MKIAFQNVLYFLFIVPYQYYCWNHTVNIGVLLTEKSRQSEFVLNCSLHSSFDLVSAFIGHVRQVSNVDSFEASKTLCEMLQAGDGVAAVVVEESSTSPILESICGRLDVPYIMTSWRPSTTKPADTFLNFFPKAELYAHALAEVIKNLQWSSFVVLYESQEGLIRMQDILKLQNFKHNGEQNNILLKQLGPGPDHRSLLKEIRNASINNIILECKTEHIIGILKQAKDQNLLNSHNNYFLTSVDAHTLDYAELDTAANITGITLFDYENEYLIYLLDSLIVKLSSPKKSLSTETNKVKIETILLYEVLQYITSSIDELLFYKRIKTTKNPLNCYEPSEIFKYGYIIAADMKERESTAVPFTHPIKFDDHGYRIDFNMYVVDILKNVIIADWYASNNLLRLRRNLVEELHNTTTATVTNLQRIVVNVSSRIGAPYLMRREAEIGKVLNGNDRFEGYSMDLLQEIAKIVGFKFEFHLTEQNEYGRWDEEQKKWTGLIGDILSKRSQLAIGDLTITHQRKEIVDFSMPFMTSGISILHKREKIQEIQDTYMFAFLDPFSIHVWFYITILYLIISVILYFTSRIVPGDWEKSDSCDENVEELELENIWDIKNCLWLTLGSIMTQGCDILPKGISSRMVISMWWFFSLILACSYTANLTAFLATGTIVPTIDSVEDLAGQSKVKYGVVDGGSTMAFFKESKFPTYQKMWANMISTNPSVFEKNNRDGVKRVQTSRGSYAFLMESTQIEYEIETKCDLKQVGTFLAIRNYGIAMPLGAPYRTDINKAILKLQESGMLNKLKHKWWKTKRNESSCLNTHDEKITDGEDLTLANTYGIFIILGVGIVIAIILAIFELMWNVRSISAEEHLTYWEALKMELIYACNVWITKKRTKPVSSYSSNHTRNSRDDDP